MLNDFSVGVFKLFQTEQTVYIIFLKSSTTTAVSSHFECTHTHTHSKHKYSIRINNFIDMQNKHKK